MKRVNRWIVNITMSHKRQWTINNDILKNELCILSFLFHLLEISLSRIYSIFRQLIRIQSCKIHEIYSTSLNDTFFTEIENNFLGRLKLLYLVTNLPALSATEIYIEKKIIIGNDPRASFNWITQLPLLNIAKLFDWLRHLILKRSSPPPQCYSFTERAVEARTSGAFVAISVPGWRRRHRRASYA